jgi:hypothetical protein
MVGNSLVGLTDYLVAFLSIFYSTFFWRERHSRYHRLWSYYFIFSAIGCLIAGTFHLFVPAYITSPYSQWLWILTLWMGGLVGLIGFNILVYFLLPSTKPKLLMLLSMIIYGTFAVFIAQHPLFKYASLFFGIMVIGQILISIYLWIKTHRALWGIYCLGWIIYTISAIQQFFKISIPMLGLNHNSLYHLLLAISWTMIFYTAKKLSPKT